MAAILWVIIFILIIALACFVIAWMWYERNPIEIATEANRKETMIVKNQFCANCEHSDCRCYECHSPLLSYEKINPVTGKNEKHTYYVDIRCKAVIGTKYCQWESKEN